MSTGSAVFITPTLLVGTTDSGRFDVRFCETPAVASEVIRSGGTARVVALRDAREVLRLLDVSEEQIERNIRYATISSDVSVEDAAL